MSIEGKANLNKDHSFTNFPITISNNVKSSVSNWSIEGNGVQASTKTYSLTEQPPISFNADGNPLTFWSMTGNGEQQGTPTPDNIIIPTFCGVRTGNLFDVSKLSEGTAGKYLSSDGTETNNGAWTITPFIPVDGDYVTLHGPAGNSPSICVYDENLQFVRGEAYQNRATNTISIQGAAYVRFSLAPSSQPHLDAMLNYGQTALPYEPYGWAEKITCAGQTVSVYLGEVPTVRRIKKLVLTGNEGWTITSNGVLRIGLSGQLRPSTPLCTHYLGSNSSAWSNVPDKSVTVSISGYLAILDTAYTTVADFKSYLVAQYAAGTPVTVWYVLATPQIGIVNEPLAKIDDYVDELSSEYVPINIPTQNGSNTLTVDTTLQPTSMTITTASSVYPKNPIDPEFVGVRTGNLWNEDYTEISDSLKYKPVFVGDGTFTMSTSCPVIEGAASLFLLAGNVKYGASTASNGVYKNRPITVTSISGYVTIAYRYVSYQSGSADPRNEQTMLNLGSTALPYEPYGYKIPLTCAGQTTNVYLGQTPTVRRIVCHVFDGTETGLYKNNQDANNYLYYVQLFASGWNLAKIGTQCGCSHLPLLSDTPISSIGIHLKQNTGRILYLNFGADIMSAQTSGNTAAGLKEYLAAQYAAGTPVTVWYVLETPETGIVNEPLCKIGDYADELLSTAEGTPQLTLSTEESNIISFETNLQPSKFNIKYYEEDYTKIKDIQMQIPTAKTYNYTEYPITINNAVSSNCNIDLFGNGIQNGTPTPDNPIMPEFCGDRTRNLLNLNRTYSNSFTTDTTKWMNGTTTVTNAGAVYVETEILGDVIKVTSKNPGYGASFLIEASPNTTYTVSFETDKASSGSWGGISDRDINGTVINQQAIQGKSTTFTTHSNCAFLNVCFRFPPADGTVTFSNIMLNTGSTALPYEPYGYKIPFTHSEQTNTVYLGKVPTVRRIKKLVFDGAENWQAGTENFYIFVTSNGVPYSSVFCTHGKNNSVNNNGNAIWIKKANFPDTPTIEDFKSYLVQQYTNGNPVTIWYVLKESETGIINEPLCKIGDYSDELQTTIQLEPFKQNIISIDTQLQPSKVSLTYKTKESTDPYKSIKYVLDNNNNYVYKSPYFYTWEGIREIVRAGKASEYYPIGSIIYDNFNESTGTAFQVVAYDNHFDPTLTAQGYTHSMTLCELLLTDVITFDAKEAFLYTEVDIPAGTYKFTIPNYDATYGGDKTYYFTSTATLPSGSQIVMNWPYQQTPKTVTGYAGPNPQTNTTALSGFNALTLTEWVDGTSPEATDLGTIAGPTTQLGTSNYGQMNHIHRARYGSNNYLQSGIRQYINSNSAANTWWTPQTVFDRPYGSRTSAGKLTKLNQDLVSVMATPEIKSRTNSYFETTSLDGTTFTLSTDYTINTDKMFLLSPMEVNFNTTDTTIGTTLDYYIEADNNKRIKIRKSNNTAYYWWLRTPYPSTANTVRTVHTSGALNDTTATNSRGAAPACIIQ